LQKSWAKIVVESGEKIAETMKNCKFFEQKSRGNVEKITVIRQKIT
jgi:hypothetical protein